MSFQRALLVTLGIGSLCLLAGCSSSSTPGGGTGGVENGGAGNAGPCGTPIDYASYATAAPVSLKNDVMPIFGLSCTASDCHKDPDRKAGLYLGVRCSYDVKTHLCTFPATPDTSGMSSNPPAPLTDTVLSGVLASLLDTAKTVNDGSVKRVVPGDPEHSFIMEKMSGVQNDKGYTCTNQDPSHTTNPQPCGDSMPLNNPAECSTAGNTPPRPSFDKIAAWIAQGAQNN